MTIRSRAQRVRHARVIFLQPLRVIDIVCYAAHARYACRYFMLMLLLVASH